MEPANGNGVVDVAAPGASVMIDGNKAEWGLEESMINAYVMREGCVVIDALEVPFEGKDRCNGAVLTVERVRAIVREEVNAVVERRLLDMEAQLQERLRHKMEAQRGSNTSSQEVAPDRSGGGSVIRRSKSVPSDVDGAIRPEYSLSHSAWDASMLIGISVLRLSESASLAVLMVLTMATKLVFCGIVVTNFTTPGFEEKSVTQYQAWRFNTAHMYSEVDKITGVTLSSRVCNLDGGLATSTGQVSAMSKIRSYMPRETGWITSGPAMCMAALVVWYLTLVRELGDVTRCCLALVSLPQHVGDRAVVGSESIVLVSVTRARKAWVILATLMRLAVLGILSYAGTLYIVYTIDMRDLLLNCVALELILNIDDLMFTSLASSRLRVMVDMMAPLPLYHFGRRFHVAGRMRGALALVAVGVTLVFAYTQVLAPYTVLLERVEETLCGGEKDFAVFVMDEVGVPIMSYTPSESYSKKLTFSQEAIQNAIKHQGNKGPDSSLSRFFALVTEQRTWHEFKAFAANADGYPGPDMDALLDVAVPSDGADPNAYLDRLRSLLDDEAATCFSLQGSPKCYGYAPISFALRFLCPVSCGCGSLYGGIIMDTNGYCPDGALDEIESLVEGLDCTDNSSALQDIGAVQARELGPNISCAEIAQAEMWCGKTSVAAFCPVSCGCETEEHPFCPPSCKKSGSEG